MRYHLFLHYGWFLQNLGKETVRTNMHTTVGAFQGVIHGCRNLIYITLLKTVLTSVRPKVFLMRTFLRIQRKVPQVFSVPASVILAMNVWPSEPHGLLHPLPLLRENIEQPETKGSQTNYRSLHYHCLFKTGRNTFQNTH